MLTRSRTRAIVGQETLSNETLSRDRSGRAAKLCTSPSVGNHAGRRRRRRPPSTAGTCGAPDRLWNFDLRTISGQNMTPERLRDATALGRTRSDRGQTWLHMGLSADMLLRSHPRYPPRPNVGVATSPALVLDTAKRVRTQEDRDAGL